MSPDVLFAWLAACAISALIGYFAVSLLWPPGVSRSLIWAFATPVGLGVSAFIFFLFRRPLFTVDALLLIVLAAVWFVRWRLQGGSWSALKNWRPSATTVLLACALGSVIPGLIYQVSRMPHGDWDAWAIWNSHARYLYRDGPDWQSGIQNTYHPDYGLLIPSLHARLWRYAGGETPEAGGMLGVVWTLASVALLAATLRELKGKPLAALLALTLLTTPFYLEHGVVQYADIPLAMYFLCVTALMCLHSWKEPDKPGLLVLAGFCTGCAGWTKNEGLLFIAATCAVLLLPIFVKPGTTLRRLGAFMAGLALPLAVITFFRLWISPPNDIFANLYYAETVGKLLDPARYLSILRYFFATMWTFGAWKINPALPVLLFVGLRGLDSRAMRDRAWISSVGIYAIVLAGYFSIYVITPMDLEWHLDSSLNRLFLQLWPAVLLLLGLISKAADPKSGMEDAILVNRRSDIG
jgi:hypothetical protein